MKKSIEKLRCRVEAALRNAGPVPWFSLETVLFGISIVYGLGMRLRAWLYANSWISSRSLPCTVVSIGNLTAGGTGKTPMTIFIAQYIRDRGYAVAVISRGYGGQLETQGGIVSDGASILVGPEQAGDEPYLLARSLLGIPVLVGRRRYATGMLAVNRFSPDVIVLDDAFQHLRLQRDFDLVLLDSRSPFGNGHLLPRGLLREAPAALKRAHAIIYTRGRQSQRPDRSYRIPVNRPVFVTRHQSVIRSTGAEGKGWITQSSSLTPLRAKKAVAFAGLADNQQFFEMLRQSDCQLVQTFAFSDHHHYTRLDMDAIGAAARQAGADLVVTTGKDSVKLDRSFPWPLPVVVIDVQIEFLAGESRFLQLLARALPSRRVAKY